MCFVLPGRAVLCIFLSEEESRTKSSALASAGRRGLRWDRETEGGKERGFGMWSECTSWNSKPFLGCQAPLTTGESGQEGRCAPSSARCGTPRSNFAAVCRALGSVEPEQLAGYGRSRGITDRCTARLCQQSLFPRLSLFTPLFPACQLICCLFLPTVLPVACTRCSCM